MGLFFKNYHILGKDTISNADIDQFDEEQSLEYLYDKVQATIDESLQLSLETGTPLTGIFGVYKSILRKIVCSTRQRIILSIIEVLLVLIVLSTFYCLHELVKNTRINKTVTSSQVFYFLAVSVGASIGKKMQSYLIHKDAVYKQQTKNVLMIMVYYKLIISDLSFLESSDNNLIYRLFYWDLNEYSTFGPNMIVFMLVFMLAKTGYVPSTLFIKGIGGFEPGEVVVVIWFLVFLVTVAKRAYRMAIYRKTLTREREVIYEWLHSYKEIMFTNLKNMFKTRLNELKTYKSLVISKLTIQATIYSYWMHTLHLLGPMVVLLYSIIRNYNEYSQGATINEESDVAVFLLPEVVVTSSCIYIFLLFYS